MVVAALGYLNPHVRNVEDELPDVVTTEDTEEADEPSSEEKSEPEAAMSQAD